MDEALRYLIYQQSTDEDRACTQCQWELFRRLCFTCKSFPCSGSGHPYVLLFIFMMCRRRCRGVGEKASTCVHSFDRKLVLSVFIVSDLMVSEAVSGKHSFVAPFASGIKLKISWISFKCNISGWRLCNGVWFHIFCGRFLNCTVREARYSSSRHCSYLYFVFTSYFAAKKTVWTDSMATRNMS